MAKRGIQAVELEASLEGQPPLALKLAAGPRAVEQVAARSGRGRRTVDARGVRCRRGRVPVNLGAVPFDALVRAIAQLVESHGLAVETIALKASGEPGRVRVETLVLQGERNG